MIQRLSLPGTTANAFEIHKNVEMSIKGTKPAKAKNILYGNICQQKAIEFLLRRKRKKSFIVMDKS